MGTLGNAIFFQGTWFLAVVPAGQGLTWPGVAGVALFAALQLRRRDTRASDLRLVALATVLGFALDTAFVAGGLLRYASPWPSAWLAPAWIVALWIALALAMNHSLRFLKPRPWLAAALGAASAAPSYLAARAFDAVEIASPVTRTLAIVAVGWALLMAVLAVAANHWPKTEPAPCPS